MAEEYRDELPEDLDVTGFVGPYQFPDNKRRRIPALIYLVAGLAAIAAYAMAGNDAVLVNRGTLGVVWNSSLRKVLPLS